MADEEAARPILVALVEAGDTEVLSLPSLVRTSPLFAPPEKRYDFTLTTV